MAGMSRTCNHVAAAMYRIEAAVRMGLTNPACTSKANEWLPNHAGVATIKVKDMKLKRDDFGQQGRKKAGSSVNTKKDF